jgi:hypothetical protein
MLHSLESAALGLAIQGLRKSWEVAEPLLERKLNDPPVALNRRKGINAGKGRGFRSHSDPNPKEFRKYDAIVPHFMS